MAVTRTGVFRSDNEAETFARISPQKHPDLQMVGSVAIDPRNENSILVGTAHLAWRTDNAGRTWRPIQQGMINDSDVMTLTLDRREPTTVFATACTGIWRSRNAGVSWTKVLGIPSVSRRTRAFAQVVNRPDTFYAGTTDGVYVSDDDAKTLARTTTPGLVVNALISLGGGRDKNKNIWIATWGGGLDRFNPNTGLFDHFHHDSQNPNSLSDDLFMDVYVDSYNMVWAGTLGKGLNRLNPGIGKVKHYLHDPNDPASLAHDNIAAIIPDGNGGLWVGNFGGIPHYDPRTDAFINYSSDPADPSSLSHNTVVSLFIDSKNSFWIGTWGGGLTRLDLNDPLHTDPKTATLTRYLHNADNSNSLSEDSVWTIHETSDGFIWLGTQLGLNRLDPHTGEFKHYTEKNGLPNNTVLGKYNFAVYTERSIL